MTTNQFLVEFFRQGLVKRGGNCASVALIKCAIGHFDLEVFDDITDSKGFLFTLKGNPDPQKITFPVRLLSSEKAIADSMHGFVKQQSDPVSDQYYEYACLCYAVMGKICQLMRGYKHYSSALNDLNRGENADFIPQFLGLEDFFMPVLVKEEDMSIADFDKKVASEKNFLLYSDGHAVFASEGIFDDHGEVVPYKEENYGFRYFRLPK